MQLKDLRSVTVVGLGLLGGSVGLAITHRMPRVEVVGFAHREATRRKARRLGVAGRISGDLAASVREAQLVILATPVCAFQQILQDMAPALPAGCVVTDVGSTKAVVGGWVATSLPKTVSYVGSHPMAGSELRGAEAARADLFERAICFVVPAGRGRTPAVDLVCRFWTRMGCKVKVLTADRHDRLVAAVSHVPQAAAAALVNAAPAADLAFAGKGFIDASRIASGPSDVWADIFLTNRLPVAQGIDRMVTELKGLRRAIVLQDRRGIETFLGAARDRRTRMIEGKIQRKELL